VIGRVYCYPIAIASTLRQRAADVIVIYKSTSICIIIHMHNTIYEGRTDEFCSFSLISLAVEHRSEPADSVRVDDGQTNSVLFHLSVWPSSTGPSQRTADGLTTDSRILFFFTYQSGRRAEVRASALVVSPATKIPPFCLSLDRRLSGHKNTAILPLARSSSLKKLTHPARARPVTLRDP
jgi:hypothetical protein